MSSCDYIPASRLPATFNLLPWRERLQAQRRRRQRLLWIAGCVLALLPGVWLQSYRATENQSQLRAYQRLRESNHIYAMQLEELARRRTAIEYWRAATTLDRQTAQHWSALASLLSAEYRTSVPVVQELTMNEGQLILHGQSSEVADLKLLESKGHRLFAGKYALTEVRRQQGMFHFRMEVAWANGATAPSPADEAFP